MSVELEVHAHAVGPADDAVDVPRRQVVHARVGFGHDRRLRIEHVADVAIERDVVGEPELRMEIDVDERLGIAEVVPGAVQVLRARRSMWLLASGAISSAATCLIRRDVIGRRGQLNLPDVERVLPVAAPLRRAGARRQIVRAHGAGEVLHGRAAPGSESYLRTSVTSTRLVKRTPGANRKFAVAEKSRPEVAL